MLSSTTAPRIPVPRKISSSEGERGVVACYQGPFRRLVYKGAGLAGYNEGRYIDDPQRPHAEAHRLQNKKIIELALYGREGGVWQGDRPPRLLDVGCGNGELLDVARAMGVQGAGITLIPEEARDCRRRGLTAYRLNWWDIGPEWHGQFDAVVFKGSIEHLVQPRDVVAGRDGALYRQLFAIVGRLLDPRSASGRMANSTIQYLRRPDPRDLMRSPLSHPFGSDAYHYAWLHHMYRGWHPSPGELALHAGPGFVMEKEENISEDYRLTAEHCLNAIKQAAVSRPRIWGEALVSLARFPRTTLTHAFGLYVSQSTNWYFRGARPPTEGVLQTWKRVA